MKHTSVGPRNEFLRGVWRNLFSIMASRCVCSLFRILPFLKCTILRCMHCSTRFFLLQVERLFSFTKSDSNVCLRKKWMNGWLCFEIVLFNFVNCVINTTHFYCYFLQSFYFVAPVKNNLLVYELAQMGLKWIWNCASGQVNLGTNFNASLHAIITKCHACSNVCFISFLQVAEKRVLFRNQYKRFGYGNSNAIYSRISNDAFAVYMRVLLH